MSRRYANLMLTVWNDHDWRSLPYASQWLYTMLISQPDINHAGVLSLAERRWAQFAEDASRALIDHALGVLSVRRFVVVDEDTEECLVRTFLRRNAGESRKPNMVKSALTAARAVQSPRIRAALADELRRVDVSDLGVQAGHRAVQEMVTETIFALCPDPETPSQNPQTVSPSDTHDATPSDTHDVSNGVSKTVSRGSRSSSSSKSSTALGHLLEQKVDLPPHVSERARETRSSATRLPGEARTTGAVALAATLNDTAHSPTAHNIVTDWAAANPGVLTSERRALGKAVDHLLSQGADPTLVRDALDEAENNPEWRNPASALPFAYARVRRGSPVVTRSQTDTNIAALLHATGNNATPAELPAGER